MRRRVILLVIIGLPLALIATGAGAELSLSTVRQLASGLWNIPDRLPALPTNSQVHYEPGAEGFAHDVEALLPSAIARVEAAHGRPFAHPVTLGVYATPEAYAAANGQGSAAPIGATYLGRVTLSPKLSGDQRQRLPAILTHELSHAHLQGWISGIANLRLPNWFKEGLAVMVSEGGGAEQVSEAEARTAIRRGEQIVIDDGGSLQSLVGVPLERTPAKAAWYPVVLAYREAGMFVTYLRDRDRPAFGRMIAAILDGRAFAEAVSVGYHDDARSLWRNFLKSISDQK
jgi:hypothetical protein